MLNRLHTLLAEPRRLFRLSLLSFLLGSTLVAVIVAHGFATREVARLRLQVAALRTENKGYRDQLGILTITDPALPHAIYASPFRTLNTWQWKFYAPEGRSFRLCLAYDGIAPTGLPATETKVVVLADNLPVEGNVQCSIYKGGTNDPQGGHVIVHLDRVRKVVDLPQGSSAWVRPTIQFEKEISGEKATIQAAADRPLILLRLRGHRITEVEQNGGIKAYPRMPPNDSPGPGILLWIEEQPNSQRSGTRIRDRVHY